MALTKIGATLGGSADVITVTQSSHGLYLGYPVKMTSSGYAHATADTAANAEAVGIVIATDRTGANTTFSLALGGRVTVDGCVPNLTTGTVLFLQVSAGLLAAAEPSGNTQVSKPMAVITIANSEMIMVQQRGEVISTAGITLADESVDSDHYVDGSIDLAHMSVNSIDSDQYVDGSIDRVHLAADIIDGTKIDDDVINSEHYVAGSIDNEHLADDAVDSDELAAGAVDIAHLSASGSAGSGTFLRGDNQWAAAGGAFTREGGTTTEVTHNATSSTQILASGTVSIPATTPMLLTVNSRKTSGAASQCRLQWQLNTTVDHERAIHGASNQAESFIGRAWVGARATGYTTIIMTTENSSGPNNTVHHNSGSIAMPIATLTAVDLFANALNSSQTQGCNYLHVYTHAVS